MAYKLTLVLAFIGVVFSLQTAMAQTKTLHVLNYAKASNLHGKPLFKYPNDHLSYIVTYTKQDLQKTRHLNLVRDLQNGTYSR